MKKNIKEKMEPTQSQQAMFGDPQEPPKKYGKKEENPEGDLSMQIINVSRRLRILEERYLNLRKKTHVTDNNMLQHYQELSKNIRVLTEENTELRKEIMDVKDKMRLMIRELKNCATSEEVKILQNYINLWEPLNFVSRNEVAKVVQEHVQEALAKTNPKRIA